jgi:hypothetical protein
MPDLPEHEERRIREYVEGQWKFDEDPVTLVQKVASERVLSTPYDVYDVHCEESRWWVVTNPTNLYSQEHFRSFDGGGSATVVVCSATRQRRRHLHARSRRARRWCAVARHRKMLCSV